MIELPNTLIEDELTLALIKAQLPRGMAVKYTWDPNNLFSRRTLLYIGPCVRSPSVVRMLGRLFNAVLVAPERYAYCDFCNRPAHDHPQPEHKEWIDWTNGTRALNIQDKGQLFLFRPRGAP